jgi:CheY-like chemotaxis protein
MNVLLVEDDKNKEEKIYSCINNEKIYIKIVRSYNAALIELSNKKSFYDYIILDMSLPMYDNDNVDYSDENEFDPFAGRGILEEIDRMEIDTHVIVVTAFDILGDSSKQIELKQLDKLMKEEYPNIYIGAIHYDISSTVWKKQIIEFLK